MENKDKNKNSPFITGIVMVVLITFLIAGDINPLQVDASEESGRPPRLSEIPEEPSVQGYINAGKDFLTFLKTHDKVSAVKLNKDVKNNLIPKINSSEEKLVNLRGQERQLRDTINNYPGGEYTHNKLELASFIVDRLEKAGLIHEIDYNYNSVEVEEVGEEEEQEIVSTGYSPRFMIKVYDIDKQGNYNKVNKVLDDIFIKEPYEIVTFRMNYDEVSESYFLMFVIEV